MPTVYDDMSNQFPAQFTGLTQPISVSDVLDERGKRYGVFQKHAEVTRMLKDIIRVELERQQKFLEADQLEALDMICHKIGRILNGDPNYDDSWRDIAGYAMLVCDRLTNSVCR